MDIVPTILFHGLFNFPTFIRLPNLDITPGNSNGLFFNTVKIVKNGF